MCAVTGNLFLSLDCLLVMALVRFIDSVTGLVGTAAGGKVDKKTV